MEPYRVNWKNYYEILKVSPRAEPEVITAAYQRLVESLLSGTIAEPELSARMAEVKEAYAFLSDPVRQAAYDLKFRDKYGSRAKESKQPAREEAADLKGLASLEALLCKTRKSWRMLGWSKLPRRAILIAAISLLLIMTAGSSLALAQPEHTLASPFKGVAATMLEASSAATSLIKDVQRVVAQYERSIVSTALQSMRITEQLKEVPQVTVATNDMACFPSPEHPLFPAYLDRRFSQFRYTVDSNGIVSVNISGATTDAFLEKIEQHLKRVTEEK